MVNPLDVLEGIEWTHDCQGKQDFDAACVSLSTRYWPRGGGYHYSQDSGRTWEGNEARPEIKPSAKSGLFFRDEVLLEQEFEADTEEEVKQQVEAWARVHVTRLREAVLREFGKLGSQSEG